MASAPLQHSVCGQVRRRTMSRLFVKNLPKYVTEERLKEHFGSQGTVTDVRIIKNKQTGESRQFGYIGFASEKEAKQARKYFNNTFVDTRRVEVHIAKPAGDASLAPWSRHSKGSSAYRREHPEEEEEEQHGGGLLTKKRKRDDPEESHGERKKRRQKNVDVEKEHFMQLSRPKSKRSLWGDESTAMVEKLRKGGEKAEAGASVVVKKSLVQSKKAGGQGVFLERKHIVFNDDDEDHDDDDLYEELPEAAVEAIAADGKEMEDVEMADAEEEPKAAFDATLSDMDYLKSLMKPSGGEKKESSPGSDEASSSDDGDSSNDDGSSDDGEEDSNGDGSSKDDEEGSSAEKKRSTGDDGSADADSDDEDDSSDSEEFEAAATGKSAAATAAEDTGRLFLRNLPFTTTEEELTETFRRFGELAEVHLPIDKRTKRGTGIAFILYMIPSDAVVAMNAMDKQFFKGRIIHVLPAAAPKVDANVEAGAGEGALSSFKKKKEAQKKATREDDTNWNTLFIRSDTVVGAMASKFGVEAGEILSADADNMAVRVALGETNIVQETKKFLQKEGVDLDVLRRQKDKKAKRSKTVFLVKNLPHTTNKEELRALFANYGELGRIVLPESRAMALVEYLQANEAKAAFNHLSYSRFHHVPLYLEWAPMMVFIRPPTEEEIANSRLAEEEVEAERKSSGHAATKDTPFSMEDASEDLEAMDVPSLFVKNLNFDTTEESLKEFVEKRLAGRKVTIRSVRIAQKNTKGKVLSMGFGFVELGSKEQAVAAMKALQGKELDGHKIELKFSKANAKPGASASVSGKNKRKTSAAVSEKAASNKLLVKNLAFQATRKELRELFSPYGQVESVRIPRKFDGTSRGYGFVEFLTKQEAKNALEALTHTHLYGRHLVLDYAQDSNKSLDELRKKAAKDLAS